MIRVILILPTGQSCTLFLTAWKQAPQLHLGKLHHLPPHWEDPRIFPAPLKTDFTMILPQETIRFCRIRFSSFRSIKHPDSTKQGDLNVFLVRNEGNLRIAKVLT